MQATLNFKTRDQAKDFCTSWTFYSKRGYVMGAGYEDVKVTLHDITDKETTWIDSYVNDTNKSN